MKNDKILICCIVGVSIIILFLLANSTPTHPLRKTKSDICRGYLTDTEYLEHMIPHHQVAIDMSNLLAKSSQNPQMLHMCRDITRKQSYEIWEMQAMKKNLSHSMFNSTKGSSDNIYTNLDKYYPIISKSKDGDCNPLFFKPNDHSKMMNNMEITDRSYLEHMIPHHQVAIDMSKRLLLHTNNSYLMDFCRKLIIDQQGEIYFMNNLLKNPDTYSSEMFEVDSNSNMINKNKNKHMMHARPTTNFPMDNSRPTTNFFPNP